MPLPFAKWCLNWGPKSWKFVNVTFLVDASASVLKLPLLLQPPLKAKVTAFPIRWSCIQVMFCPQNRSLCRSRFLLRLKAARRPKLRVMPPKFCPNWGRWRGDFAQIFRQSCSWSKGGEGTCLPTCSSSYLRLQKHNCNCVAKSLIKPCSSIHFHRTLHGQTNRADTTWNESSVRFFMHVSPGWLTFVPWRGLRNYFSILASPSSFPSSPLVRLKMYVKIEISRTCSI